MVVRKALYGLKSSGAAFWAHLAETLYNIGFRSSKADDRIPSTTPGAEPPRDAKDTGSARLHSTHLETNSSNRP